MQEITAIKNYILYLRKECNLSVTLHVGPADQLILSGELLAFNIHDNSYCIYAKGSESLRRHCVQKQQKVMETCKNGSFTGVCHAGVKEYVYPISDGKKTVGFISVSGYRAENGGDYIKAIARKYTLPKERLASVYRSLKESMPDKEWVDTLIFPLCHMLELAYMKKSDSTSEQGFCQRVEQYLKIHHTRPISSRELCEHFSCSRSYISHRFNDYMKMGIRPYLNRLRIEDAKGLLEYSELTVTEIALSVGFSDSNYFTEVFKKATGLSPRAYKRRCRENK